jgi:fused signal recognition particle receptor
MDQRNFEFMFYGLASALLVIGLYTLSLASRERKIGEEIRRSFDRRTGPAAFSVRPWVVFVVGVNGAGKTTTIGKLAAGWIAEGRSVLLCAADTFRAAAVEQLEVWAGRAGAAFHRGARAPTLGGADRRAPRPRAADAVLVDTAGRLHTKSNLMAELAKMARVAGREVDGAPHETLLVLDATVGSNGLAQGREFAKAGGVTGLVLTKLDGTAKGGVAVAVVRELGVPIRYVGVGEKVEDLLPFDATAFAASLVGAPP